MYGVLQRLLRWEWMLTKEVFWRMFPSRRPKRKPTTMYVLRDQYERAIYIGITGRGIHRIHEHGAGKPWFSEVRSARFYHYDTRVEAARAERKMIRLLQPRYNRQHNPNYGVGAV